MTTMGTGAALTGAIMVLRAAAMFDGISPTLVADPSVVVTDRTIVADAAWAARARRARPIHGA
jgi:hypothetical protein